MLNIYHELWKSLVTDVIKKAHNTLERTQLFLNTIDTMFSLSCKFSYYLRCRVYDMVEN